MVSSSSYAPNESYATIVREELWLQGTFLSNFIFGIQTTLCLLAFLAVLRRPTIKHTHGRKRMALLVYIALLFAIMTAEQGLTLNWIQMAFIMQRNYPGGPDAYLSDVWSTSVNLGPSALAVFANWMMESLLVWRCHVVCTVCSTGEGFWWLGFSVPCLLLTAVFVIGSLMIHQAVYTTPTATVVVAYGITSLALDFVATGFIAARLLVHRHRVVSQLGRAHGQHYVSIATVIIESAAVFTGFLVIVIVAYAIKSPATILLRLIVLQVQAITSFFIIWWIARGQGWKRPTDTEVVSAAISSLNSRTRPPSQSNVIQLEVLPTRRDEEEGSMRPTENGSKESLRKTGEA